MYDEITSFFSIETDDKLSASASKRLELIRQLTIPDARGLGRTSCKSAIVESSPTSVKDEKTKKSQEGCPLLYVDP
jgi:hypothetical protein